MPSVLVELGFISTPAEEKYLSSNEGSTSMANSIFNAFLAYKTEQQAREASTQNAPPSTVADDEEVRPIANVQPTQAKRDNTQAPTKTTPTQGATSKATQTKGQAKTTPEKEQAKATTKSNAPVFKIQFLTASSKLANNDKRLKGLQPVDYYIENGTYKYTYGASTDYNEILRLRKKLLDDFPQAFIIAFKDGQRMDITKAIQEFRLRGK